MREIKFRAWDKELMIMYDAERVGLGYSICSLNETPSNIMPLIFMQYTGLFDKQGKEIYEGDIVKTDYGRLLQVLWDNATFVLVDSDGCYVCRLEHHKAILYKIIGNVYENPNELSKVK